MFVKEARRVDGKPYTPCSLSQILSGIATTLHERSDEKWPIEELCTSDMAELCHWLCVVMKEARRDSLSQLLACWHTVLHSAVSAYIPLLSQHIYHLRWLTQEWYM